MMNWLLASDFNLIRSAKNRNKPGGDLAEMQMFNDCIVGQDLVDLTFNGRNYTWSNMQSDPLLVKLDWAFINAPWNLSYPATLVKPLSRPISDHIPFVIHIDSCIPKANIFRFENFWLQHPGFKETVANHCKTHLFMAMLLEISQLNSSKSEQDSNIGVEACPNSATYSQLQLGFASPWWVRGPKAFISIRKNIQSFGQRPFISSHRVKKNLLETEKYHQMG